MQDEEINKLPKQLNLGTYFTEITLRDQIINHKIGKEIQHRKDKLLDTKEERRIK